MTDTKTSGCAVRRLTSLPELTGPIKAPFWKNLYFLKDGRTHLGLNFHKTEREAVNGYHEWMGNVRRQLKEQNIPDMPIYQEDGVTFLCFFSEVSHAIQIPAKAP